MADSPRQADLTPEQAGALQGNVLAPFNKDHVHLLALGFPADPAAAKTWLTEIADQVASHGEVDVFNSLFRNMNQRRGAERGVLASTWIQLLLTAPGLRKLGVLAAEIQAVDEAFAAGMPARADLLGDRAESDPSTWVPAFANQLVDAMLVTAADEDEDLLREADRLQERAIELGLTVLWSRRGDTLPPPLTGHEHFGFKDGVSQPDLSGPNMVPLSQFLLGHAAGPTDPWGAPVTALPTWAQDASLIAFRVMYQDVARFRAYLADKAGTIGLSADQLGAKLMGRWPSGAPTAAAPDADDPTLAADATRNNAFDYSDDPNGLKTPRFAHIRKAFPRKGGPNPPAGEADKRRILRRGLPYGPPLPPQGANAHDLADDRGLLFFAAQANLGQQFEFIQSKWCNDPNFPTGPTQQPSTGYVPSPNEPADGPDPIIGQHHGQGADQLKTPQGEHQLMLLQFTKVRAGAYFLSPTIPAIRAWGAAR